MSARFFIEFIKQVWEKRQNARLAKQVISFHNDSRIQEHEC